MAKFMYSFRENCSLLLCLCLLVFMLAPSSSFASVVSPSCGNVEKEPSAIGKNEMINAVGVMEDLLSSSNVSEQIKSDVSLFLQNKQGILGGFSSVAHLNGVVAQKIMLYAHIDNFYIIAGYVDIEGKKELTDTFFVEDNGDLQIRSVSSAQNQSRITRSAQTCPAGQTKRCTYEWNCLKKVSPGWAISACSYLPSHAAQVACMTVAAASYIAPCCKLTCVSDFN